MKRIEITYRSNLNEMNKQVEKLARAEAKLVKATEKAEKLGIANWDGEQYCKWLAGVETNNGWIVNKDDIKKNGAWFDLHSAKREVEEIKAGIERLEKRLAKSEEQVEAYYEEIRKIEDLQQKELLWKLEFEQEQKEWKRDGITLEGRYWGVTPNGKRFWIERNNGWTERSLHCFTLTIDGNTIFTSGEFWRAYAVIKNS